MGGTFDHLHDGHKFLIKTALTISKNIVIGLTTPKLLKNKRFSSNLEDYNTRKHKILEFISSINEIKRVEIVKLNDPYGPPIHDPDYEGIVVSQETYKVAVKINEIRETKGFTPLIIIVIPIIKDDNNKKVSSTSIRENLNKKK